MKIMTFNTQHCLNYLEREIDFDVMAKAILSCDADIVGLNEMRGQGDHPEFAAQVAILAECTGIAYHYFAPAITFEGMGSYGNGLLSKYPIVKVENIPIPDPEVRGYDGYYESRCVLKATLEDGVTVLVSHFGLNPDEAENAVQTVLDNLAEEKCILMGDFNVKPENPVLDPIRARMKDVSTCFAQPLYSFPSDVPNRKIDYIFVSPDIQVQEADIPAIVASDHRPHTATVRL